MRCQPHPFNSATTIRYTLARTSDVRLVVYNALGREVRMLVNGAQAVGMHTVQWDGRDAFGRAVSTGLYLYRLEAGPNTAMWIGSTSHPAT